MSELSISLTQYFVLIYAIIIGTSVGFYLILLSKLQDYWALKKNNRWNKIKTGGSRIILAGVSIYIVFIMPIDLLRHYIFDPDYLKKLYDLYFYSVICSGVLSTFILIKLGKIRVKRKP